MTARFPSVIDLGANNKPQIDVSHNNTSPRSEILANKFDRAPDAARVVAFATSVAKAESIPQLASWTDMIKENHELVKQNQAMAELNHMLAIVVQQTKLREEKAARSYECLEKNYYQLDREYQRDYESSSCVIANLEARVANNNAELISELRDTNTTLKDTITSLEEDVEAASWNEWHKNEEIRRLEEMVDSKNILRLEKALDWERSRNCILRDEMSDVCMKKNQEYFELYTQLRNLQASHPVGGKAGERDRYMSNNNASLFSCSDDDGSI